MDMLVTMLDAKEYLAIDDEDAARDSALEMTIEGLSTHIENYTGRSFSVETVVDKLDGGQTNLPLTKYPVVAVSEVKDLQDNSVLTADTDYLVDEGAGLVYPADALTDSFTFARVGGTVFTQGRRRWQVTYTAGTASVPNDIQLALLRWLQSLDEAKGGLSSEKIGDYAYTVDSSTVAKGAPSESLRILDQYRGGKLHI